MSDAAVHTAEATAVVADANAVPYFHATVAPPINQPVVVEGAAAVAAPAAPESSRTSTFSEGGDKPAAADVRGHLAKRGESSLFSSAAFKQRYIVLSKGFYSYFDSETAFTSGKTPIKDNRVKLSQYAVLRGEPPIGKALKATQSAASLASPSLKHTHSASAVLASAVLAEVAATPTKAAAAAAAKDTFYLEPLRNIDGKGPTRRWEFRIIPGQTRTREEWIAGFEAHGCTSEAAHTAWLSGHPVPTSPGAGADATGVEEDSDKEDDTAAVRETSQVGLHLPPGSAPYAATLAPHAEGEEPAPVVASPKPASTMFERMVGAVQSEVIKEAKADAVMLEKDISKHVLAETGIKLPAFGATAVTPPPAPVIVKQVTVETKVVQKEAIAAVPVPDASGCKCW